MTELPDLPHTDAQRRAVARAGALIELQRYDEAAAVARSALAADPHDPDLAIALAVALCEGKHEAEAVPAAERAVALQPGDPLGHRVLGRATYHLGRYTEATSHLTEALVLDPHDGNTHVMLAETLMRQVPEGRLRTRRRDELLGEAERHADEAIRLEPTEAGGYLAMATTRLLRRDAGGTERWARQALAVQPHNASGHELLGLAAELRKDVRAASDHYVDAGKVDPRSDSPIRQLRALRAPLPVGILAVFVGTRVILFAAERINRLSGPAATVGALALVLLFTAVLVMFPVYYYLWPRWKARRAMSPAARNVLRRAKQSRR